MIGLNNYTVIAALSLIGMFDSSSLPSARLRIVKKDTSGKPTLLNREADPPMRSSASAGSA